MAAIIELWWVQYRELIQLSCRPEPESLYKLTGLEKILKYNVTKCNIFSLLLYKEQYFNFQNLRRIDSGSCERSPQLPSQESLLLPRQLPKLHTTVVEDLSQGCVSIMPALVSLRVLIRVANIPVSVISN